MTDPIFLWPPNPDPESWKCDTPNEGLQFDLDDKEMGCPWISEFKNSYTGICLAALESSTPTVYEIEFEEEEYAVAYGLIRSVLDGVLSWKTDSLGSWKMAVERIIHQLKSMGWFEVEAEECEVNGEHHYFRRKK